jgi:PQQ-like domain
VKIDLRASDPVGQSVSEAHLHGAHEAPEEDPRVFCLRVCALGLSDAHLFLRVAQSACRSHVETSTNLAECATELFTELLWKRRLVERGFCVRAETRLARQIIGEVEDIRRRTRRAWRPLPRRRRTARGARARERPLVVLRLRDGALARSLPIVSRGGISIDDVESDGRGGWFIGGDFTSLDGVRCSALVHVLASLRVNPKWCPHIGDAVDLLARAGRTLYVVHGQGLAAIDVTTGRARRWQRQVGGGEAMAAGGGRVFLGEYASDAQPPEATTFAIDARAGRRLRWTARFGNKGCGTTPCYLKFGAIVVRGGVVYVGGAFSRVQGQKHVGFVALDARTARPLAWRADVDRDAINTWVSGADSQRWHIAAVGHQASLTAPACVAQRLI